MRLLYPSLPKILEWLQWLGYWICQGYYPKISRIDPEEYWYQYGFGSGGYEYARCIWRDWCITWTTVLYTSELTTRYYWINKGNGYEFVGPFDYDKPFTKVDDGYDDIEF